MYAKGEGVAKDAGAAVRWYRQAAEQGYADAQYNLGVMYLGVMYHQGEGVLKDAAEAVRWFRLAAEQGDAQAQYSLGVMYAKGEGVPKNMVEAYAWCNIAAAQSDTSQQLENLMLQLEKIMTSAQLRKAQKRAHDIRNAMSLPYDKMPNQ